MTSGIPHRLKDEREKGEQERDCESAVSGCPALSSVCGCFIEQCAPASAKNIISQASKELEMGLTKN